MSEDGEKKDTNNKVKAAKEKMIKQAEREIKKAEKILDDYDNHLTDPKEFTEDNYSSIKKAMEDLKNNLHNLNIEE